MASLRAPEYSKQILNVVRTFSKHILFQINRMIRNIQVYIKIIKYHRSCTFFRTILILKRFWLQRKLQTCSKLRVVARVYVRPFSSSSNSSCENITLFCTWCWAFNSNVSIVPAILRSPFSVITTCQTFFISVANDIIIQPYLPSPIRN